MRNGAELREDRGNAIISTEPLLDPFALELPLARQRRVALGAAVRVQTSDGPKRLELMDAHLEPVSSAKTLWVFKNPRAGQVRAILDPLDTPRYASDEVVGIVLGGDFNTVQSGADEDAYHLARAWATGLVREDARNTHLMGRLDFLFFRMADGWTASTRRLDERFGSDHYPGDWSFSATHRLPVPCSRSSALESFPEAFMRLKSFSLVLAAAWLVTGIGGAAQDFVARARALHKQAPLIDGHNDYPWALRGLDPGRDFAKADISEAGAVADDRHPAPAPGRRRRRSSGRSTCRRRMQGKEAVRATLEQIDIVHRMTKRWPETFEMAYTAADVERAFKAGRIGSMIGMEGGHSIDNSLATLRMLLRARRALHDADPLGEPARGPTRPPTSPSTAACRSSAKRSCAR